MHAFPSQYSCAFHDHLHHVVWDVLRPSPYFAYTACIASMILHTVRFLCVTYAEICINATADCKPTAWFFRTLVDNRLFWTQKWQEHFSFLPHQTASMCWPMEIKRASWSFLPPVAPQSWSESCARTPTRNCCSQPAEYSKCSQWTLTTNRPLWR